MSIFLLRKCSGLWSLGGDRHVTHRADCRKRFSTETETWKLTRTLVTKVNVPFCWNHKCFKVFSAIRSLKAPRLQVQNMFFKLRIMMFIQFAMSFTKKSNGAMCHDVKNSWVKLTKQYETWTDIKQSYMNDVVELFCNPIFLLISHMVRKKHQKSHHVRPVEGNRRAQNLYIDGFWRSHALKPPEVMAHPRHGRHGFSQNCAVFLKWRQNAGSCFWLSFDEWKWEQNDLAFSKSSAEMPWPLSITF